MVIGGLLGRLDAVAHFLYAPTLRSRAARARWHHHIHLIPGRLLQAVCDRYEQRLLSAGFYEKDEPVGEAVTAFENGDGGTTGHPQPSRTYQCPHMTASGPLTGPPVSSMCDCEPVLISES